MGQCFRIITPVYNAESWIENCITSVKNQTHQEFTQVIVDDCSTDDTVARAREIIGADERFHVVVKKQRMGTVHSHKLGVETLPCDGEDVIVHLDGDDWFSGDTSLEKVNQVYESTGCWLTYGSYTTSTGETSVARKYTNSPRQAVIDGWPFSHLRTFKRHLWDLLTEDNFRSKGGQPYTAAADVVIFVPILEKIGYDKVRFIEDPLVIYNLSHGNNEHKTNLSEQVRNALDVINK